MLYIDEDKPPSIDTIRLRLRNESDMNLPTFCDTEEKKSEAYSLTMNSYYGWVEIHALTAAGVMHGVQTLKQLLYKDRRTYPVNITDCPRFEYRGLHVDMSRNFHGSGNLKKLMDVMAMYKMNKLHLHLTDDEGWRLEIPGLHELTWVRDIMSD